MQELWIYASLLAAFGQALAWALKKKSLEGKGINKTLGAVAYLTAGLILSALFFLTSSISDIYITDKFIYSLSIVVSLNVLAAWCAFKALDYADLSKLMPFMALTTLGIVPLEYFIRDIIPTNLQLYGIATSVLGSLIFTWKGKMNHTNFKAGLLFSVTLICYAITSTYMAVLIDEIRNPLFVGAAMHIGIALGFIFLLMLSTEKTAIATIKKTGSWSRIFGLMIISGLVIALLENGPIFLALESANSSEVFSIKRIMPIFALILGVLMFKETVHSKHIIGTIMMIFGAVLIVLFKP